MLGSKDHKFDSPEAEIAFLEQRIADDQAHVKQLQQQKPFAEFPKMVKGLTFASRGAQDEAGPDYADAPEKAADHGAEKHAKAKKEHA